MEPDLLLRAYDHGRSTGLNPIEVPLQARRVSGHDAPTREELEKMGWRDPDDENVYHIAFDQQLWCRMTDKQKIPLAQFDATMSREEMARNLLSALQKAGFKTPPLEKVLEASTKKTE